MTTDLTRTALPAMKILSVGHYSTSLLNLSIHGANTTDLALLPDKGNPKLETGSTPRGMLATTKSWSSSVHDLERNKCDFFSLILSPMRSSNLINIHQAVVVPVGEEENVVCIYQMWQFLWRRTFRSYQGSGVHSGSCEISMKNIPA